ncbi:methylated-DNA--[protein]-cysteine S-methyltransferase [Thermodesulfitimonas sp.]
MPAMVQEIEVPVGRFTALWSERGLSRLLFPGTTPFPAAKGTAATSAAAGGLVAPWAAKLAQLLKVYFNGGAVTFGEIPVDFTGYTPFQVRVLQFIRAVPYGTVVTYGAVAAALGRPGAARAVGQALARNRTPVVVPCHRVVGRGWGGGFAGGLRWKEELLHLEGVALLR